MAGEAARVTRCARRRGGWSRGTERGNVNELKVPFVPDTLSSSCLGGALVPLSNDGARVQQSLAVYRDAFHASHDRMLAQKLGLSSPESDDDQKLAADLFELLQVVETDYTLFFRGLSDWPAKERGGDANAFLDLIAPAFYTDALETDLRDRWRAWSLRYARRVQREPASDAERMAAIERANPKYVLRNYLAQNAITAAERGDLSALERLMRVLKTPYDQQPEESDLAARRSEWARSAPGRSALSCSS